MSKLIEMSAVMMLVLSALALALGGCGDDDGGDGEGVPDAALPCVDNDEDTYGANCEPGPDCDDTNPDVHEVVNVYLDYDRDGYGAGSSIARARRCAAG